MIPFCAYGQHEVVDTIFTNPERNVYIFLPNNIVFYSLNNENHYLDENYMDKIPDQITVRAAFLDSLQTTDLLVRTASTIYHFYCVPAVNLERITHSYSRDDSDGRSRSNEEEVEHSQGTSSIDSAKGEIDYGAWVRSTGNKKDNLNIGVQEGKITLALRFVEVRQLGTLFKLEVTNRGGICKISNLEAGYTTKGAEIKQNQGLNLFFIQGIKRPIKRKETRAIFLITESIPREVVLYFRFISSLGSFELTIKNCCKNG